jgi:ATP-dependent RNA helicase SUPV3L1/SUV3
VHCGVQVKQIAGRAGRHGTEWEQGWATCLDPDDLPLLYAGVAAPPKPAAAAGLFPMLEQLQGYAGMMPRAPLAQVFDPGPLKPNSKTIS